VTWPTLLLVFFAGWAVGIWNAEWIREETKRNARR